MVENLEVGSNPNAIPDFQMRGQTGLQWPVNIRKNPESAVIYFGWIRDDADENYGP